MRREVTRRDFVKTAATGAAAAGMLRPARAADRAQAPAVIPSPSARPVIIASANGNFHKNGGRQTCVETAFELMMQGTDILEALIAGVNIVELDPEDTSVGYGGLPMRTAWCSSTPAACTVLSAGPAGWPLWRACARRPKWRTP